MTFQSQYVLTIDRLAMERCFIVADILADVYGQDYTEYGLIGLAKQSEPFHIVATPLLHGQQVTDLSVYQAGYDVFRLRDEMDILSKRLGQPLVPIAFIHRHPSSCGMSIIDEQFLTEVFVNQVSTVVTLQEMRIIKPGEFDCSCAEMERLSSQNKETKSFGRQVKIEYGVCFSIIINRDRQFSIDAAKKEWCPFCNKSQVSLASADLRENQKRSLTEEERKKLRKQLEVEIEAKLRFERIGVNKGA